MTINDIQDGGHFNVEPHEDVIIKVIGVGGGGSNAINHMYAQHIEKVSFVVCNTDRQALNSSPVPNRLLIGPNVTHGLGAGNKPEVARKAAEESADDIAALFDDETKMVFITAGMGGGTGTGAAPVVARIAKERGLLTIGIVTIPFLFEGERKILKALEGAEEMSKYVDALLVVNNERLTEIYYNLDFMNAFEKADDTLSNAARSISEIITCEGYMNLDFNDVNTTLRDGGAAIISTGYGEGENRVTKAIEDALNSPLLKNRDILGSKKLLFHIYFSRKAEHKFIMEEAKELTNFMSSISPDVDVIWGVGFDDSLGNKVKIAILAAGFELTIKGDLKISSVAAEPKSPFKKPEPLVEEPAKPVADIISNVYGTEKVAAQQRNRSRHMVFTPDMLDLDDDAAIDTFEHAPTFTRDKKVADEFKNAAAKSTEHEAKAPTDAPADAPEATKPADNGADNSRFIEF